MLKWNGLVIHVSNFEPIESTATNQLRHALDDLLLLLSRRLLLPTGCALGYEQESMRIEQSNGGLSHVPVA